MDVALAILVFAGFMAELHKLVRAEGQYDKGYLEGWVKGQNSAFSYFPDE